MTDEIQKPTRTKLRRYRRGLEVATNCNGQKHVVVLTPKGHVVMKHHPDTDLESEMAMKALGGEACKCAELFYGWRAGGERLANVPSNISRTRPESNSQKLGARLWRVYKRKHLYINRSTPRKPWPTCKLEALEWLGHELRRVGLTLEPEGWRDQNGEFHLQNWVVRADLKVTAEDTKNAYDKWNAYVRLEISMPQPNHLFIQAPYVAGLGPKRIFTPKNICMAIELIGKSIFTTHAGVFLTRMQDAERMRHNRDLAAIVEQYDSTGGDIDLDSGRSWTTVMATFTVLAKELGGMPYIIKRLSKLLDLLAAYKKIDEGSDK